MFKYRSKYVTFYLSLTSIDLEWKALVICQHRLLQVKADHLSTCHHKWNAWVLLSYYWANQLENLTQML